MSVGDGVVFSQSPRPDMTSPIIVIPEEIQKGLHRLVKYRDEDDGDVWNPMVDKFLTLVDRSELTAEQRERIWVSSVSVSVGFALTGF